MSLNENVRDLEQKKFRAAGTKRQVAVTLEDSSGNPLNLTSTDFEWDSFDVTFPSATQEVYAFSLASVVVKTFTLNYQDASKKVLVGGTKA